VVFDSILRVCIEELHQVWILCNWIKRDCLLSFWLTESLSKAELVTNMGTTLHQPLLKVLIFSTEIDIVFADDIAVEWTQEWANLCNSQERNL